MVLFKKIRPRRGSLAVSIICGSPIAASNRSAAFAYFIGSLRHDSKYSAIDRSLWLRASKDRAKALNRESLYMPSLRACGRPHRFIDKAPGVADVPESGERIELIGHSTESFVQRTPQALRELRTGNRPFFGRKTGRTHWFPGAVPRPRQGLNQGTPPKLAGTD